MNKWQEFARINNMNEDDFSHEIIECAQAVMAINLIKNKRSGLMIEAEQGDATYRLTFEVVPMKKAAK